MGASLKYTEWEVNQMDEVKEVEILTKLEQMSLICIQECVSHIFPCGKQFNKYCQEVPILWAMVTFTKHPLLVPTLGKMNFCNVLMFILYSSQHILF